MLGPIGALYRQRLTESSPQPWEVGAARAPFYTLCGAEVSQSPAKVPRLVSGGVLKQPGHPSESLPGGEPSSSGALAHPALVPEALLAAPFLPGTVPPLEGATLGIQGKERGTETSLLGKRFELP